MIEVEDNAVENLETGWFEYGNNGIESGVIFYVEGIEVVFSITELQLMVEECKVLEYTLA